MSVSNGTSLTPGHYDMLMRGLRSLNDVAPLIQKAKRCGVDCGEFEQGQAYLSDAIHSFLREFFPDQVVPPTGTGVHSSS